MTLLMSIVGYRFVEMPGQTLGKQLTRGSLASVWFQGDSWLDFNMIQSGHGAFRRRSPAPDSYPKD